MIFVNAIKCYNVRPRRQQVRSRRILLIPLEEIFSYPFQKAFWFASYWQRGRRQRRRRRRWRRRRRRPRTPFLPQELVKNTFANGIPPGDESFFLLHTPPPSPPSLKFHASWEWIAAAQLQLSTADRTKAKPESAIFVQKGPFVRYESPRYKCSEEYRSYILLMPLPLTW